MRKFILILSLLFLAMILFSCQSKQNLVKKKGMQSQKVVMIPDVPPVFTQGDVVAWVGKQLRYPEAAYRNHIGGRVFVEFVIDKKGRVINSRVMKSSGHQGLDAEALRVVSELPKWHPGQLKGKKVDTIYILPVSFSVR